MAAIIGPNGAGKTTVFNLITGVYAPTAGEIWFEGKRVASAGKSLKPHQLTRRGIARTFQNIRLFGDLSVEDNVRCAFAGRAGYGLMSALLRDAKQARQEAWIKDETARLLEIFGLEKRSDTLGAQFGLWRTAQTRNRPRDGDKSQIAVCLMSRLRA